MLGLAGAGGAGLFGGALGQFGDALSAPRRAMWQMLGMPETGRELVGGAFGLDQQGALAGALGMGAEMLLDPLTIAGLAAGGPLAKLAYSPWAKDAQIAGLLGDARAGIGGADAALASRSALEAQTLQAELQAAMGLGKYDVPGIAQGATKQFAMVEPAAEAALLERGLGVPGASVSPSGMGNATLYGAYDARGPVGPGLQPFGFNNPGLQGPKGRMMGKALGLDPSVAASEVPRALTEFDRQFLQKFGSGQTLGGPMSRIETQAALESLGGQVGANINAARPMPTLAEAAQQNPLLEQLLGGRMGQFGGLPLPDARAGLAGEAEQLGQLLQSRKMTPRDWAMVAGAGGLGLGAGAVMGGR